MTDRTDATGVDRRSVVLRRGPAVALAFPVLLASVDSVVTIALALDAGRCGADCSAGLLLLIVAPTTRALDATGWYGTGALASGWVIAALLVTVAATVIWWRAAGVVLARVAALSGHPYATWWLGYGVLIAATVVVKIPVFMLDGAAGTAASLPVEIALWVLIAAALRRWYARLA